MVSGSSARSDRKATNRLTSSDSQQRRIGRRLERHLDQLAQQRVGTVIEALDAAAECDGQADGDGEVDEGRRPEPDRSSVVVGERGDVLDCTDDVLRKYEVSCAGTQAGSNEIVLTIMNVAHIRTAPAKAVTIPTPTTDQKAQRIHRVRRSCKNDCRQLPFLG